MKNRIMKMAAVAAFASAALSAGSINFDDQPTAPSGIASIALTNQYAAQGVLFNLINASQSFKLNVIPASSPNYASLFFGNSGPGDFIFVDPTNSAINAVATGVSFTLVGLNTATAPGQYSGATIEALDIFGNVIAGDTQVIAPTSTTTSSQVLSFAGQVHEIRFTLNGGSGILPFDDLTFRTLAVPTPEPGTFALIGAGLLIAAFRRRR